MHLLPAESDCEGKCSLGIRASLKWVDRKYLRERNSRKQQKKQK